MLSDFTQIKTLVLKYFEKGHTFMSADSYHHSVESAMEKMRVYDFSEFVNALNVNGQDIILSHRDIISFPKGSSKGKATEGRPERFTKDLTRLEWKYNFDDHYRSSEFLMKKILKSLKGKWPPFP